MASSLHWADRWGTFKARWGINRMNYKVGPGLYALGHPDHKAPVFITANYKMSFDQLRHELPDRDAWILVLDTKGINVWCAAGKGTFGTSELVARIRSCRLEDLVLHREVILPQLAGPGVSAHQVKKLTGFNVIYGPIRAMDLPAFFDAGLKATSKMRLKTFSAWERAVLIPMELVGALKYGLPLAVIFSLADLSTNSLSHAICSALSILAAIVAGAVLTPFFLPWLPGRAFSLKGLLPGIVASLIITSVRTWRPFEIAAWFLIIPAISTFLAMNFTGASTYTSLSGVKKEMRLAVPLQIGAGILGLALWIGSHLIS